MNNNVNKNFEKMLSDVTTKLSQDKFMLSLVNDMLNLDEVKLQSVIIVMNGLSKSVEDILSEK